MRVSASELFLLLFYDDRAIPTSEPSGYELGRTDDRQREEGCQQERQEYDGSPRELVIGG